MKNITNIELMENEVLRKEVLDEIGDNLRNSDIWNIGTKFETICNNYMTVNQVAEFFECKDDAVKKYYKDSVSKEGKDELINAGMNYYSYKEIVKLIENAQKGLSSPFEIENMKNSIRTNSTDCKNDVTDEFKPPVRGCWLFTLESVCKLGMLMTGTPKAIEFRDRIISTLKIDVAKTEDTKELTKSSFEMIKNLILEGKVPNVDDLINFLDQSVKSAEKISFTYYKEVNKDLEELKSLAEDLLDSFKDTKHLSVIEKAKRDVCQTIIQLMSNILIENKTKIEEITMTTMKNIGTQLDTNLTDMLEEKLKTKVHPRIVKAYKDKLVDLGILKIVHPVSKRNSYDSDGNLVRAKGDINTDVQIYVPTEKFEWFNTGKFSNISLTAAAQRFDLSECGKEFILKALFEGKVYETEQDFIDYLLNKC